jgi:hypothetical protein
LRTGGLGAAARAAADDARPDKEIHTMQQKPTTPQAGNRFRVTKLEERIAPKILQVNGGGNVPNGQANGVPSSNPAGNEPPGQNK